MATSRTGTTTWKRVRDQALAEAFDQGLMKCPLCRVPFDWSRSKQPNSPEVDHIVPHARGGTDTIDNVRVICRLDNQRLGGSMGKRARPVIESTELDSSPIW